MQLFKEGQVVTLGLQIAAVLDPSNISMHQDANSFPFSLFCSNLLQQTTGEIQGGPLGQQSSVPPKETNVLLLQ